MKTMISKYVFVLFLAMSFFLSTSEANAREYDKDTNNETVTYLAKQVTEGTGGISTWININGISSFFDWQGITGFNPNTGASGTEYPKYKVGVIYRDGLVWGGRVQDPSRTLQKFVDGNSYVIGTIPGKIVSGSPEDWEAQSGGGGVIRCYRIRGDFRIMGDAVLTEDAAAILNITQDEVTSTDITAVQEQYGLDWREWPTDRGAPYYDEDGDGTYNPVLDADNNPVMTYTDDITGEVVYQDYPGYGNGDQVIWYVINDMSSRSFDFAGSDPVGVEIQTTVWAYNIATASPLGNVFFKRYFMENHSGFAIDSMYVAQWSDPDLGAYSNDVVGCDSVLSLMYAYNGEPTDGHFAAYGLAPGASGYDFLQGPLVDSPGDSAIFNGERVYGSINLGANAFSYFSAGGDPAPDPDEGNYAATKQWYNMLQGYLPTDTDYPTTPYTTIGSAVGDPGEATFFPLAGKPWLAPYTNGNDIDGFRYGPADRRMNMSTGPFTMAAGDIQEIVVGVIGAISNNYIASVKKLVYYDRAVQEAYDNFFDVPKPPVQPAVVATPLGTNILLDWGGDATAVAATEKNGTTYKFEGYNVYQYDPQRNPVRIATIDVSNGVQAILQQVFDDGSGNILEKPVQIGTDSGIQRYISLDRDYFTQGRFAPGHEYVFAVTAYNYTDDPTVLTVSVENSLIEIRVTAQGEKPGDDLSAATGNAGDAIDVERVSGLSGGGINAFIINPVDLKDQTFVAEFTGETTYNLINTTTGDTLLKDFENAAYADETPEEAADPDGLRKLTLSPSFDGVAVSGYGPPIGADYWDYQGARWISGYGGWGMTLLFDGAGTGAEWGWSSYNEADTWECEMVFVDRTTADYADPMNTFPTLGATYRRDIDPGDGVWTTGYAYNGIGAIPFEAFDMTDAANPRKVNIVFVENDRGDGGTNANLIYDFGWNEVAGDWSNDPEGNGAREYLFIMDHDYNEGADYSQTNNALVGSFFAAYEGYNDHVWMIGAKDRGGMAYLGAPFTMQFVPFFVNKAGEDVFTFSTTSGVTGDLNLARAQFEKATIWPNPYYAYNTQETSNFGRFVTVSNLPQKVTMRIFNLAGTLVRKIEKDNADQFQRWDLLNETGLPVASGLYIYHIDAPDLGKTKVLKGFIIQAKQKLQYF